MSLLGRLRDWLGFGDSGDESTVEEDRTETDESGVREATVEGVSEPRDTAAADAEGQERNASEEQGSTLETETADGSPSTAAVQPVGRCSICNTEVDSVDGRCPLCGSHDIVTVAGEQGVPVAEAEPSTEAEDGVSDTSVPETAIDEEAAGTDGSPDDGTSDGGGADDELGEPVEIAEDAPVSNQEDVVEDNAEDDATPDGVDSSEADDAPEDGETAPTDRLDPSRTRQGRGGDVDDTAARLRELRDAATAERTEGSDGDRPREHAADEAATDTTVTAEGDATPESDERDESGDGS